MRTGVWYGVKKMTAIPGIWITPKNSEPDEDDIGAIKPMEQLCVLDLFQPDDQADEVV